MERIRTNISAKRHGNIVSDFRSSPFRQYMVLMLLLILGVIIGAIYIKNSGVEKTGLEGTGFFMQDILSSGAASKGFFVIAASSFFPVSALICCTFLLGVCALGYPFIVLTPVIHGAWLGASMAAIDLRFGIKGLGICLLFIMPQALLTSLSVMLAARDGFKFSRRIYTVIFGAAAKPVNGAFKIYCFKFVVSFLLVAAASALQACSVIIFAKIFFS